MTLDIVLSIIAIACMVVGFIGCVVPVLPGAPLTWAGLLIGHWISYVQTPIWIIILCGAIAIAVSILDNFLPPIMTKKCGGSKAGTRGCVIGLIIGMFTGPWGIIIGPFIGALVGELIHDNSDFGKSFKAALGAFGGFCCGIGMKMIASAAFITIWIVYAIK